MRSHSDAMKNELKGRERDERERKMDTCDADNGGGDWLVSTLHFPVHIPA